MQDTFDDIGRSPRAGTLAFLLSVTLLACAKAGMLPTDAGPTDAGPTDGGPKDDGGPGDSGPGDAGPGDAGPGDGGDAGDSGPQVVDYSAVDFDTGQVTSLAQLRGSPVLLTSWATSSAAAATELPGVEAFWHAHQPTLTVIAVNVDAVTGHAAAAQERQYLGLTIPVWSDPGDAFAAVFGTSGVPATALIDSQGYLLHVFQGALDPSDSTLLALLAGQGVTFISGTPCGASDTSGSTCILVIEGQLSDLSGSPIPGAGITYCGVTTCFYGDLNDAGTFRVELGLVMDPTQYDLIIHGGMRAAGVYEQLAIPSPVVDLTAPIETPLYTTSGQPVPVHGGAQSELVSGEVALDIPAGASFTIPLEDFIPGDGGNPFVTVKVEPAAAPAFAPPSLGLLALYALGPFGAKSSMPVGVRVPNPAGLTSGAAVEFLALDVDLTSPFRAGTMQVVAQGAVSADGGFVSTNADAGISTLTWLAVRRPGS
jgi:peroxiredoxin